MKNSERALVVISDLSSRKEISDAFKLLYRYLESEGVELALKILGPLYKTKTILTGADATSTKFINALRDSANDSIKEVDVLIHLHGLSNHYLYFHSDQGTPATSAAELCSKIKALKIEKKLRMLYSTACYGAAHAKEFIKAGFTCASGAKGINTSTTEYPTFLKKWSKGNSFGKSMDAAENRIIDSVSDAIARPLFPGEIVNSDKVLLGKLNATINSA